MSSRVPEVGLFGLPFWSKFFHTRLGYAKPNACITWQVLVRVDALSDINFRIVVAYLAPPLRAAEVAFLYPVTAQAVLIVETIIRTNYCREKYQLRSAPWI